MTRGWSLRTRFVVFATACLLPLFAVLLFVLNQSLEQSRTRLLDTEAAIADVVARNLRSTLEDTQFILNGLANSDDVQLVNEDARATLAQYRRAHQVLTGLFLIDPNDQVVVNTGPDPQGVIADLKPALTRTFNQDEVGISSKLIVDGTEVIAITVPVWADPVPGDESAQDQPAAAAEGEAAEAPQGQPVAAVGALLSIERLGRNVVPLARGDTTIAVVATDHVIIGQTEGGDSITVHFADQIDAAVQGMAGNLRYEDTTGVERLAVYAPIEFSGADWAVLVTSPSPTAYGANRSLLTSGLIALALAGVVTLGLAVFLGEVTARPLRLLTSQAAALRRGDFNQRIEPVGSGEVRILSTAFADMAGQLADHMQGLEGTREDRERRTEQMRDLLRRTVRLQEDERRRIAGEIHDAVSPLITGALYQARALRLTNGASEPAARDESLGNVSDLLERATNELHGVIFALRPPDLDDIGVVAAIERYVQTFQLSGLTCRIEVVGEQPPLTPEVRLGIYRIVQEALHNVARHAGADEAVVRLESTEHLLRVTIRDNGAGFDPDRAIRPTSLGLLNMRERAAAIGASFSIVTRPGGGTAIVIERSDSGDIAVEDLSSPLETVDTMDAPVALEAAAAGTTDDIGKQ